MIEKIAAIVSAGVISAVMTSAAPGSATAPATRAVFGNGSAAPLVDTIVVDRTHKSDRLPLRRALSSQHGVSLPKTMPLGCDPVFSPIADPAAAHIFRRCAA